MLPAKSQKNFAPADRTVTAVNSQQQLAQIADRQTQKFIPQGTPTQATQKNLRPLRKRHRNASKATAQSTQNTRQAPAAQTSTQGYRPPTQAVILFSPQEMIVAQQVQRDMLDNAILDTFAAAQRNGEHLTAKDIAAALNEPERTIQYRVQKLRERISLVSAGG